MRSTRLWQRKRPMPYHIVVWKKSDEIIEVVHFVDLTGECLTLRNGHTVPAAASG
eukprot:CAMPEP_0194156942 /NCGR_PEP_ID=MMETSP0152-20130528/70139_1 /TAXON_ID=1049557 /ORGANISM="Thalassiothrix antarctica, Strain L6-D1" /LENGTH=54 /DNA_ID=CAMNT_0038864993 /DNA_START=114 /DNA_END=278 /DNA_ORIENTATION=-